MIQRRTKTDKLDAQLLANLLRINQIPLAYIPPEPYQQLRELTRCRARWAVTWPRRRSSCGRLAGAAESGGPLPSAVRRARPGMVPQQDFGPIENLVRDELLARLAHYSRQIAIFDEQLARDVGRTSRRQRPSRTSTASACSRPC